jgi:hypothetical protein
MNALVNTVNTIDTTIREALTHPTMDIKTYGMTKAVIETGSDPKEYPAVLTTDNEIQAAIDDNFSICTWHKVRSQNVTAVEDGFGDEDNDKASETSMSLLVWGNLNRLQINETQLANLIHYTIPSVVNVGINGVYSTSVDVTSVNYESKAIFEREFQGVSYNLDIGSTIIQIDYSINMQFNKSCVAQCTTC